MKFYLVSKIISLIFLSTGSKISSIFFDRGRQSILLINSIPKDEIKIKIAKTMIFNKKWLSSDFKKGSF